MSINIQHPKHMKCSYGSYANKRTLLLLFFFFSFHGLFWIVGPALFFFLSCHKQCCLFEFSSLAVILKCSRRFINFIPHLMADPSYPFVQVLMALVFKRKNPFILQTQTSSAFLTQTLSPLPFLHRVLLLKHSHPFTNSFLSALLGFSFPLGLPKWPSTLFMSQKKFRI